MLRSVVRSMLAAITFVACSAATDLRSDPRERVVLDLSAAPIVLAWQAAACDGQPTGEPCMVEGAELVHVTHLGTWQLLGAGLHWMPPGDASRLVTRRGPGPGELLAPITIGAKDDTSLLVYDIARAQLVQFSPTGFAREWQVLPPQGLREARIRHGRLLAYMTPPAASLGVTVQSAIVAFNADRGEWSDTVARFSDAASSTFGSEEMQRERLPWESRLRWDVCADGTALVAISDRWEIVRLADGDTVQRLERAGGITDPLSDATVELLIAEWEHGALRRRPEELRASALSMARQRRVDHRPQLDVLSCDESGAITIGMATLSRDSSQKWVRVSSDGDILMHWQQAPAMLQQVVGEALVGVVEEDGAEKLVVTRPPNP